MKNIKTDICIIGAGSGGLSVAAGSSQMGANVVLIEHGKMGGDCLNYGCVPSKSILAAAKRADLMRHLDEFGIDNHEPIIDYAKIRVHIRGVIAAIEPHDSVERFQGLGVTVIQATAKFIDQHTVVAGEHTIKAKYFVIATGSSPIAPPIPGLDQIPYLTNETIFDLDKKPEKLIVIGGGPVGCEMAQAHCLLGTDVVLLATNYILPKDDVELVALVRDSLIKSGVDLYETIKVLNVESNMQGVRVTIEKDGKTQQIVGSHILVATGRKPNLDQLDLSKAGVTHTSRGVVVDQRLRSNVKRIFVIGDAAGSYQFTHVANYHAGIVIRNMLFHLPAKVNYRALPWVTFTKLALAHVGLNEEMAKQQNIKHRVLRMPMSEIDRAQAEHETQGLMKVIVSSRGKILGASIVAAEAGELIMPWVLAINNNFKIGAMTGVIVPYPTRSDISKIIAGEYFKPTLFSDRMRKIVRFLLKF